MTPLFTTITTVLASLVPRVVEDCYDYFTKEEPKDKRTYLKLTPKQNEKLILMYAAWKEDPSLYASRTEFTKSVNKKLGTSMTPASLFSRIHRVIK
jgi:hypothetical protein